MKSSLIFLLTIVSFSLAADIVPPPANYSIAADGTVIDINGEVNDDPLQAVPLNSAEIPTVQADAKVSADKVKEEWIKRKEGAVLTSQ